jgi:hypothetical protein
MVSPHYRGDAEMEVIEANLDWLMPRFIEPGTYKIILAIQSYILRTPCHTIMTCSRSR